MQNLLKKLSLLNRNGTISITNSIVLLFVLITAFKTLFAGLHVQTSIFDWKVDVMDLSSTLPLLFSLVNYGHKRQEENKFQSKMSTPEDLLNSITKGQK